MKNFESLYKNIYIDELYGKSRNDYNSKKDESIIHRISTEVTSFQKAASFNLLIRNIDPQWAMDEDNSLNLKTGKKIFSLINNSFELSNLEKEYENHSSQAIVSYKTFVNSIYKGELKLEINRIDIQNNNIESTSIDYKIANEVLENFINLTYESEEDIISKGRFRAIHCDTAHYAFTSNRDVSYNGYFHKDLEKNLEQISFLDQSVQFRLIENKLGIKKDSRVSFAGKSYYSLVKEPHQSELLE